MLGRPGSVEASHNTRRGLIQVKTRQAPLRNHAGALASESAIVIAE
jgi:hypothetical protein